MRRTAISAFAPRRERSDRGLSEHADESANALHNEHHRRRRCPPNLSLHRTRGGTMIPPSAARGTGARTTSRIFRARFSSQRKRRRGKLSQFHTLGPTGIQRWQNWPGDRRFLGVHPGCRGVLRQWQSVAYRGLIGIDDDLLKERRDEGAYLGWYLIGTERSLFFTGSRVTTMMVVSCCGWSTRRILRWRRA